MGNIVEVKCYRYTSDWFESPIVKIDLNKFIFFTLDFRGDEGWWHIIGHYTDKDGKWEQKELSVHGCRLADAAKFVHEANKKRERGVMVSRFNNLHYSDKFYNELKKLLDRVNDLDNK